MNNFYNQPAYLLWIKATLLLLIGFYPTFIIIEAGHSQPLYYLLFFIFLPVFQFSSTPFFKLAGIYKYYSPMLLGYMANKTQIDLHSGSSFDYLFVMRKYKIGVESRKRIMIYHLEGLLNIIALIQKNEIPPTVQIMGTSYFFNERTISKLGFVLERPSMFYRLNLLVNFIDLFWMYSFAKGHFSIPKVWDAKKVKTTGSVLVEKQQFLMQLHAKMKSKLPESHSIA